MRALDVKTIFNHGESNIKGLLIFVLTRPSHYCVANLPDTKNRISEPETGQATPERELTSVKNKKMYSICRVVISTMYSIYIIFIDDYVSNDL